MKVPLFIILILSIFDGYNGYAQDGDGAYLVKDINTANIPSTKGSEPVLKVALNGVVYFVADDGVHGKELWRTDGTAAGTIMLKDIYPGFSSSFIPELIVSNGTLFFPANDPEHGMELWRSDGTEQGTVLVADILPGSQGSNPENLLAVSDNAIFFIAFTPETGKEPWRSNGEPNGTALIKDINSGSTGSDPATVLYHSGQVYFDAVTTEYGRELWKSSGQVGSADMVIDSYAGSQGVEITTLITLDEKMIFTTIVPDFYQGVRSSAFSWGKMWISNPASPLPEVITDFAQRGYGFYPTGFTFYDHNVYYTSSSPDDENLDVLWRTDGTMAGTRPVEDLPEKTINAQGMVSYQGYLYLFSNKHGTVTDFQMVKTDGTSQGTTLLKSTFNVFNIPVITALVVNYKLYIITNLGIWQSDGSEAETKLLTNKSPISHLNLNDVLYLGIEIDDSGSELCLVDPVTSELQLIKAIHLPSEPDSSNPSSLVEYGNKLYFIANNDIVNGLYVSNGSGEGTEIVVDQDVDHYAVSGETVYFTRDSYLYKKVSNEITFLKVFPVPSGYHTVSVFEIIPFKGIAFIVVKTQRTAHPSVTSAQLWRSDGTETGTFFIDDIAQSDRFVNYSLRVFKDHLFFWNSDGLTKTDGTLGGTHLVKDGFSSASRVPMVEMNGNLYFAAEDDELWRTDGTAANTVRVKDIQPYQSTINYLTVVKSTLFFVADDGVNGPELWKTDGTEVGTVLIKDISLSNNEYTLLPKMGPNQLASVNDTLYFSANDDVHGYELWKSDGTTGGTVLVKDLIAGAKSSSPRNITGVNGKVLFLGNLFDDTQQQWTSNTSIVYGDSKLWELDKDGAHVVGGDYLVASEFTMIDTTVFFAAASTTGRELWSYQVSKPKEPVITDVEKELEKLSAYPNPTTEFVTITLPNIERNVQYKITDMFGRVALSGTSYAHGKLKVDLSTLSDGLYLFHFSGFQHTPVRILKLRL